MYNKLLYGTISSKGKEAVRRLSHHLSSKPLAAAFLQTRSAVVRPKHESILRNEFLLTKSAFNSRGFRYHSSADQAHEDWLPWLRKKKKVIALVTICYLVLCNYASRKLGSSSRIVKAGDPRLHEPVREVYPEEIGSERIQKVIDDLVKVMRKQDIISLSAPQIGVPLQIIVLDKFPLALSPKESYKAEDKHPHDLLVIVNPKLKQKSRKKGLLFESCVSVPGYAAAVERFLEVEVRGLNRYGQPIKVDASGLHARVLQHECDHLEGTLYVDKMVKQTFGTEKNTELLLAKERDQQGVH